MGGDTERGGEGGGERRRGIENRSGVGGIRGTGKGKGKSEGRDGNTLRTTPCNIYGRY